jgi:hypothetical protein
VPKHDEDMGGKQGSVLQYPAMKYVGLGGSHIHNWRFAHQPAILYSDAEGNKS